jgi:hypothetical protein
MKGDSNSYREKPKVNKQKHESVKNLKSHSWQKENGKNKKSKMMRWSSSKKLWRMIKMDKFVYLIDYLKRETRDDFYLELKQIEEIAGVELSKSAYEYSAYWSTSGAHYLANQIWDCGFKVSPDLKNKRVRLIRTGTEAMNSEKPQKSATKTRTTQRRQDVPQPSKELVEHYLNKWDKLEDYSSQEEAVNRVFRDYNSNKELENILIKCSILNDFYSTNIFKIYPVAKHIQNLDIDSRLKEGDPTLVDEIAKITIGGKTKNFYSFASKYCSHHNQLDFPIYDSYVHKVLKYYRNVDKFFDFEESDLKAYPKFKNILVEFRSFYKLDEYNLKELDKYLWQFGKEYFPNKY